MTSVFHCPICGAENLFGIEVCQACRIKTLESENAKLRAEVRRLLEVSYERESSLAKCRAALIEIRDQDYRGNRCRCSGIAKEALEGSK